MTRLKEAAKIIEDKGYTVHTFVELSREVKKYKF